MQNTVDNSSLAIYEVHDSRGQFMDWFSNYSRATDYCRQVMEDYRDGYRANNPKPVITVSIRRTLRTFDLNEDKTGVTHEDHCIRWMEQNGLG